MYAINIFEKLFECRQGLFIKKNKFICTFSPVWCLLKGIAGVMPSLYSRVRGVCFFSGKVESKKKLTKRQHLTFNYNRTVIG